MGSSVFYSHSSVLITMERVLENLALLNFHKEKVRLNTYRAWTSKSVKPHDLAQSGFRYIHLKDSVKCVFCDIEVFNWDEGDDVMREHQKFSPNCRLLCREKTENEPIDIEDLDRKLPPPLSPDECVAGKVPLNMAGTVSAKPMQRFEHEIMRQYLIKYGYLTVKTETG